MKYIDLVLMTFRTGGKEFALIEFDIGDDDITRGTVLDSRGFNAMGGDRDKAKKRLETATGKTVSV